MESDEYEERKKRRKCKREEMEREEYDERKKRS
jgi:hypothetical protein